MIISHSKQFAFFRNPKTGSTTASFVIRLGATFAQGDHLAAMPGFGFGKRMKQGDPVNDGLHMTPQDAIIGGLITKQQLIDYNSYAFVRDPYVRAISALIYANGRHFHPGEVEVAIDFHEQQVDLRTRMGMLMSSQKPYFHVDGDLVITPLKMGPEYVANVRQMVDDVGGVQVPNIPRLNDMGTRVRGQYQDNEWFTPRFRAWVESMFADDIAFFNSL